MQATLDSIYAVHLYTASSSNPAGLADAFIIQDESSAGYDMNCNGNVADAFNYGGFLVNPASVTATYKTSQVQHWRRRLLLQFRLM